VKPLVVGNWKMNLDHVQAIHLTQQLGVLVRTLEPGSVDVAIAAPFTD
jgi:triosephosphate isomerase